MKLILGVITLPYMNVNGSARRKKGAPPKSGAQTTGDVAKILEAKYGVMGAFYQRHQVEVTGDLVSAARMAVKTLMQGGNLSATPFISGTSKIEERFKKFLSSAEIEGMGIPGVPTLAAIKRRTGKSSRFKVKKPSNAPSFIDTGLYQSSAKAWVK